MDKSEALKVAKSYYEAVRQKFDFVKMYLFGSYSKDKPRKDSDIDIAIVFKDYDDLLAMQLELMRLRRKIDSRIEPHPYREKEFNVYNPLANEILKYGIEL